MELASLPEVNLANLIIKRNDLEPGFDIKALLSHYADLRFGDIPNDVDGISINLKSKKNRPIVFISSSIPPVRQRFTMAHELGHIVIPWHIGAIISHTQENHGYTNRLYHDCEVEANRFAAELLMPTDWVKKVLTKAEPAHAMEIVRSKAGTSHLSTFYKIGANLSSQHIGVLTDHQGKVVNSVSTNSRLHSPATGSQITNQAIFKNATKREISMLNSYKIYWLEYSIAFDQQTEDDSRTWRDVLYSIIEDLKLDEKIISQISGCLAYLNKPNVMHEEFLEKATQRICSDNRFYELSQHPNFRLYLTKKISELIQNRKIKG